ncbi:hypothetical protein F5Y17DRAFT_461844 [Xylariaceae sp. FL0594]|nr:hypothetical protein F5Y17DRAFT_461844 [Xylariaceae sp. FL0594]
MMFTTTMLSALLAPLTLAVPTLVFPCSFLSGTPCVCPPGTLYQESITTAVIGAPASAVAMVMNDFYKTEWLGVVIDTVEGPDNFPALSTRRYRLATRVGTYKFADKLTFYFVYPDGSFEHKFQQDGPVPFNFVNGTFGGRWATIKGTRVFANETLVTLTTYACNTGHPFDFGVFYSKGIINATNILTAAGLVAGVNAGPFTAQAF